VALTHASLERLDAVVLGARHHRHVSAGEQELNGVVGGPHPTRRGERPGDLAVQHRDPPQGESQLIAGRRKVESRVDSQRVEVDVRLQEPVEEHEPVGPGRFDLQCHGRSGR
jgi:hypothetical protein